MKTAQLKSRWKLYYLPQGNTPLKDPEALIDSGVKCIPAEVPGNVEIDLSNAGILPRDLLKGMNSELAYKYETYEWWYETEFDCPGFFDISEASCDAPDRKDKMLPTYGKKLYISFDGVDLFATYFLNGVQIGESRNAFTKHSFDISGVIQKHNRLFVRIESAVLKGAETDIEPVNITHHLSNYLDSINMRKPAHSYGWDIFPRCMSSGITGNVELSYTEGNEIRDVYFFTKSADRNGAAICFLVDTCLLPEMRGDIEISVTGKCGDSTFYASEKTFGKAMRVECYVPGAKLWWPRGYGKPDLYDVTVEMKKAGTAIASRSMRIGIRTLNMILRPVDEDHPYGIFRFECNGERIFPKGSNWVPLSPYHSRSRFIYDKAISLAAESNCNILRVWGGGAYEDDRFYDLCDENGIMVWQDFMMACAFYPQTEEFLSEIKEEFKRVITRLRNHPSLAVFSGDNENDAFFAMHGLNPNNNKITRDAAKDALWRFAPHANFIYSSPFIDEEMYDKALKAVEDSGRDRFYSIYAASDRFVTEQHLWGPRDYYKSNFYLSARAAFISEIGYHGMPDRMSMESIVGEDHLWPYKGDPSWILHSTDTKGYSNRVELIQNQVLQLFGKVPDNLEDYILASQFSQAEAMKFFVEHFRMKKWDCSGFIWWNLLDGWPQLSDAVVDSYFRKKLAFYYIKRSQEPFCIMMDEPDSWGINAVAVNDTLEAQSGHLTVTDGDTGAVLAETDFAVGANGKNVVARMPFMYSDKKLYLIKWTVNGKSYYNHYISGSPAFSLGQFKAWGDKIKEFCKD